MFNDKKYEIRNEKVTVLVKGPDYKGNFAFDGLIVNAEPNIIYKEYVDRREKEDPGKTFVLIQDYLYAKLKKEADAELGVYIEKNINNQDFYTEKMVNCPTNYSFWDTGLNFKDQYPDVVRSGYLNFGKISEGVVQQTINGVNVIFGFIQDAFISMKWEHAHENDDEQVTPMEIFYDRLNEILAIEQYRRGIAHPAYTEIVNLNKWLEGKQSVKIVLKNGTVYECKARTTGAGVQARSIITLYGEIFYIKDSFLLRPKLDEKLPIADLDYLQYGKHSYRVNTDNLVLG